MGEGEGRDRRGREEGKEGRDWEERGAAAQEGGEGRRKRRREGRNPGAPQQWDGVPPPEVNSPSQGRSKQVLGNQLPGMLLKRL